jgi:hypothetical protein
MRKAKYRNTNNGAMILNLFSLMVQAHFEFVA